MAEQEVISYAYTAMKNLSGVQKVMHSERHLAVFLASFHHNGGLLLSHQWMVVPL